MVGVDVVDYKEVDGGRCVSNDRNLLGVRQLLLGDSFLGFFLFLTFEFRLDYHNESFVVIELVLELLVESLGGDVIVVVKHLRHKSPMIPSSELDLHLLLADGELIRPLRVEVSVVSFHCLWVILEKVSWVVRLPWHAQVAARGFLHNLN